MGTTHTTKPVLTPAIRNYGNEEVRLINKLLGGGIAKITATADQFHVSGMAPQYDVLIHADGVHIATLLIHPPELNVCEACASEDEEDHCTPLGCETEFENGYSLELTYTHNRDFELPPTEILD